MAIDINEAKVNRNIVPLWLSWTLATAVGMAVGHLPAAYFVGEVELGIARILVPLLAGLLIGFAQWLVLRGYVNHSADWIFNLAGGWVVGYIIGLFIVQFLSQSLVGVLIGFILFGIIVALFQYPVLRREIPHVFPWIIANVIGWTLGAFASQWIASALFTPRAPENLAVTTMTVAGLTGLLAGAVTGIALIWIVRKPEGPLMPNRTGGR